MSSTAYVAFALALAGSTMTPGPDVITLATRTASRGWRAAVSFGAGLTAGKLLLLIAAYTGGSAAARNLGPTFTVLQLAALGYLVWMGIRLLKATAPISDANGTPWKQDHSASFGLGILLSATNPMAVAFYAALLPGIIDLTTPSFVQLVLLAVILVSVMILVVGTYAALGTWVGQGRRATVLTRVGGALVVGTALWAAFVILRGL